MNEQSERDVIEVRKCLEVLGTKQALLAIHNVVYALPTVYLSIDRQVILVLDISTADQYGKFSPASKNYSAWGVVVDVADVARLTNHLSRQLQCNIEAGRSVGLICQDDTPVWIGDKSS